MIVGYDFCASRERKYRNRTRNQQDMILSQPHKDGILLEQPKAAADDQKVVEEEEEGLEKINVSMQSLTSRKNDGKDHKSIVSSACRSTSATVINPLYCLYRPWPRKNTNTNTSNFRFSFRNTLKKKKKTRKLVVIPEENDEASQVLEILKSHHKLTSSTPSDGTNSRKTKSTSGPSVGNTLSDDGGGSTTRRSSSASRIAVESGMVAPEELLYVATSKNDIDALRILLDTYGLSLDQGGEECGQTALHVAAENNCELALTFLLERGASVSAQDHYGASVLQSAVIAGHVNIAKLLLDHGADPNQVDEDGDSPRLCAIDDGSPEMQYLFDEDFDDEDEDIPLNDYDDQISQESSISWDTEFTIEQIPGLFRIVDQVPPHK